MPNNVFLNFHSKKIIACVASVDSPKFSLQFSDTQKLLQISVDRLQTAIFITKLELVPSSWK